MSVVRELLAPQIKPLRAASTAKVLAIGIVAGLAGALLCGRLIAAFLFNTSPYDPAVIGVVIATTTVTSLVAMAVPGIRAGRLDPVVALRAE